MKKTQLVCLGLAFGLGMLTRGLAAAETEPSLPTFTHPREITNPYLPLGSLKQDVLVSKHDRVERTAKPELHKTFQIGNQTVEALVVEDREYQNGALEEVALDYFAQDDAGAVYYLGEDVDEYKNGKISGHSGAWLYGKDTRRLGLLIPAHPKIGDKFKSEDVPGITTEDDEVISVSQTGKASGVTYKNCIQIKEKLSDGQTEYKLYAAGVGCVKESEPDAQFVLKSHKTK